MALFRKKNNNALLMEIDAGSQITIKKTNLRNKTKTEC